MRLILDTRGRKYESKARARLQSCNEMVSSSCAVERRAKPGVADKNRRQKKIPRDHARGSPLRTRFHSGRERVTRIKWTRPVCAASCAMDRNVRDKLDRHSRNIRRKERERENVFVHTCIYTYASIFVLKHATRGDEISRETNGLNEKKEIGRLLTNVGVRFVAVNQQW